MHQKEPAPAHSLDWLYCQVLDDPHPYSHSLPLIQDPPPPLPWMGSSWTLELTLAATWNQGTEDRLTMAFSWVGGLFLPGKKQGWKRAKDTCSDSGRHIWQGLQMKRKRMDEGVKVGELWLSPLSTWPCSWLGYVYCWSLSRKAGDTRDCWLGRGAKPFCL